MSLFESRRSIRNYDSNYKIKRSELDEILRIAFRAPSSINLQPIRLLVIESPEAKNMLKDVLFGNQLQLETSSAMIVVFTDTNKYEKANKIFSEAHRLGIMPESVKDAQLGNIERIKNVVSKEKILTDGLIDAGLFSMQLMLVAKEFGYDTCPIGGFNKEIINKTFGISESLRPALIVSIGKANEKGFESYRLPLEDTVKYI